MQRLIRDDSDVIENCKYSNKNKCNRKDFCNRAHIAVNITFLDRR